MNWLARKVGTVGAILVLAAVAWIVFMVAYTGVKRYFTDGLTTQVEVGKAQTGAAIQSGKAAVNTVGQRQQTEASGAAVVQETQDEIDKAADPGGVTDAGLNGLHRVRGQASPSPRR